MDPRMLKIDRNGTTVIDRKLDRNKQIHCLGISNSVTFDYSALFFFISTGLKFPVFHFHTKGKQT